MERLKVSDEWLYKYMPIVDIILIQELEEQVDNAYVFSYRFKRKMKRLMWKEAHSWLNAIYDISKRIAIFFLGVISALLLVTMSVEAYRIKFFDTIKTVWEDSIWYSYFTDNSAVQFRNIAPSYIPEGYVEIDRIATDNIFSISYENEEGELIIWDQILAQNGESVVTDSEYDLLEIKEIDGHTVEIYLYSDGYINAYYEYEEYAIILSADNLELKDIYAMIENMEYMEK